MMLDSTIVSAIAATSLANADFVSTNTKDASSEFCIWAMKQASEGIEHMHWGIHNEEDLKKTQEMISKHGLTATSIIFEGCSPKQKTKESSLNIS